MLLFFSNTKERVQLGNLLQNQGRSLISLLGEDVDQSLVDIFSYTLMPNHFHLVIRQKADDGVSKFMRKLATAYSMYFNIKYDHSGVLFQGRFKSRHIGNEAYFRYIFAYVHLNSLDLFEPGWEEQGLKNLDGARQYVNSYRYSSFFDYVGNDRPEKALLSLSQAPEFLTTQNDLEALLQSFNQGQSLIVDVDRKG